MKKIERSGDGEQEKTNAPFSSEYYHGMPDTVIEGNNEYRTEVGALIQLLQPLLLARSVTIEVIQAKEMLEGLREDVECLEKIEDSEQRKEKELEIRRALNDIGRFIEVYAEQGLTPRGKEMTGLREPSDPSAQTFIPPDWNNPGGRLQ